MLDFRIIYWLYYIEEEKYREPLKLRTYTFFDAQIH